MGWTLILIIGLVFNNWGAPLEKPVALKVEGISSQQECEKAITALKSHWLSKPETAVVGYCVKTKSH